MSKLLEMQFIFTFNIAKLILWAADQGYKLTLGEGYDDDNTGHMKGSTHYIRLGQDFNLFVDGKYITDGEHPAFKRIGEAWKSLHSLNCWGGDFKIKDSNHFSMKYGGHRQNNDTLP